MAVVSEIWKKGQMFYIKMTFIKLKKIDMNKYQKPFKSISLQTSIVAELRQFVWLFTQ